MKSPVTTSLSIVITFPKFGIFSKKKKKKKPYLSTLSCLESVENLFCKWGRGVKVDWGKMFLKVILHV